MTSESVALANGIAVEYLERRSLGRLVLRGRVRNRSRKRIGGFLRA